MRVSVILCTYNRCESLRTALQSVAACRFPDPASWEVLVVDNNSKDQTRAVVEEFVRQYPGRFRYLFEPQPGKSHALNSGIQEARGDILAFMDDDVTVDPGWLQTLTNVLQSPEFAGVGGRILPERSFAPPAWLSMENRYALAPLAIFDLGTEAHQLPEPPFGTNMAFRKEMFVKYGGFRKDLGPRPGSEIRGEDTEFGDRILLAGERLWYEPAAVVYHSLPANRLRKEYFLKWWYDKARADLRADPDFNKPRLRFAGAPLVFYRRLIAWALRWMFSFQSARRFSCKLKVWMKIAEISEARRMSRDAHGTLDTAVHPVPHEKV